MWVVKIRSLHEISGLDALPSDQLPLCSQNKLEKNGLISLSPPSETGDHSLRGIGKLRSDLGISVQMFWALTSPRGTRQIGPKWSCLSPLILQGIRVVSRQSPANRAQPAQPVKRPNFRCNLLKELGDLEGFKPGSPVDST